MADDRLTEIARDHWLTAVHANRHLRFAPDAWTDLRQNLTAPPSPPPFGQTLGSLMGIRVVVDEGLPPGTWKLVDNATGEEIEVSDHG